MYNVSTIPLEPVPAHSHCVRFYDDDAALLIEVAYFLREALAAGGTAIAIATAEHGRVLRQELQSSADQTNGAALIVLDASHTLGQFMQGGAPDPALFDATVGTLVAQETAKGRPVHAFGEMVALLCEQNQYDAALLLEDLWNQLAQRHTFGLFCGYKNDLFASSAHTAAFEKVCAAHNHIRPSTKATPDNADALARYVATLEHKASVLQAEITRREHVERALRDQQRELEATVIERTELLAKVQDANRAKNGFLALLGHELRNPLAPIVTALQMMRMRDDTHTEYEQSIIRRQVDHLKRLIDDLLDISNLTRGNMQLQSRRVSIRNVIEAAVDGVRPLLEQKSHRLTVASNTDWQVDGDVDRLVQIFANLLSNAARYTPPRGAISITVDQTTDSITVNVADNGIGFAPETAAKIFDLFFQATRDDGAGQGGLGIGLALVRRFAELHGGTVHACSDGPGHGSTFSVTLPLAKAPTRQQPACEDAPADARLRGNATSLKIAVVDDNVDAANTLGKLLSLTGNDVRVFDHPIALLETADSFIPDIGIFDIGLPVMSGYDLALRLREFSGWDQSRFIALTGYGQESDRARSKNAGYWKHLVKPVDIKELLSLLHDFAASKQR